jgi:hypothetical protein
MTFWSMLIFCKNVISKDIFHGCLGYALQNLPSSVCSIFLLLTCYHIKSSSQLPTRSAINTLLMSSRFCSNFLWPWVKKLFLPGGYSTRNSTGACSHSPVQEAEQPLTWGIFHAWVRYQSLCPLNSRRYRAVSPKDPPKACCLVWGVRRGS